MRAAETTRRAVTESETRAGTRNGRGFRPARSIRRCCVSSDYGAGVWLAPALGHPADCVDLK
jgi:hypothetical protein